MGKIIKNASSAFGYNYASLADIVNQGMEIPQMRIKPTEFGDYVEYKDVDGNWQIGSKVVIPDMKGKNAAQMYGAGLTYARRYTALNALSLVCSDDADVETVPQNDVVKKTTPTGQIVMQIGKCKTQSELEDLWASLSDEDKKAHINMFSQKKARLAAS